jgi:5-methylthioadenosine/S-adenosylhomocysteine deaminase
MGKTVIRGGAVLTMDPSIGNLATGDVLIEDDKIAAVEADLGADVDAEVIDATGRIIIPGFVDTHRHTW